MKDEVMELIQRDLDNDLNELEKERLQQLLHRDPQLQLVYARLRRVSDQLANLPPVSPPYSLVDAILPRLEAAARPADEASHHRDGQAVPRLIARTHVSAPVAPRSSARTFPAWLAKAGTGAVAAALLGILLWANIDETVERQQAAPPEQPRTFSLSAAPASDGDSVQATETVDAAQAKPDTGEPAQLADHEQQTTPQHPPAAPAGLPASNTETLPTADPDEAKQLPQAPAHPAPSVPASKEQGESGASPFHSDNFAGSWGKAAAAERNDEREHPLREQQDDAPEEGEKRTNLPASGNASAQSREQQAQRDTEKRKSEEQQKKLEKEREKQQEKERPNKQDEARQNADSKGRPYVEDERANGKKRVEADHNGEDRRIRIEQQGVWRDVLHFRIHINLDRNKVTPPNGWRE